MHREDDVQLLLAHVEDHPVAQDARDIDDDVEPAEVVDRLLDHLTRRVVVRDGTGIGDGVAARRLDLVDDLLSDRDIGALAAQAGAEVIDDDRRALRREQHRDAAPDAPARAGDNR